MSLCDAYQGKLPVPISVACVAVVPLRLVSSLSKEGEPIPHFDGDPLVDHVRRSTYGKTLNITPIGYRKIHLWCRWYFR